MDPRNGESPQSDLGRKRMQRKVGDHSRRCGLVRGTKAQSQNEQYMQETLGAGGTRNWDGRRVGSGGGGSLATPSTGLESDRPGFKSCLCCF